MRLKDSEGIIFADGKGRIAARGSGRCYNYINKTKIFYLNDFRNEVYNFFKNIASEVLNASVSRSELLFLLEIVASADLVKINNFWFELMCCKS